jgi:lantibiotic modifying enzyme
MQAWCHGSEGIILARLEMPTDVTTEESLQLINNRLIGLPLTTNPSVCHGIAGRLIAVDEANRYGPQPPTLALSVARHINDLEFALLDLASRQRTINGSSIELWNEGFMIGRAGIIWTLAKLRLPHTAIEPSLLRLSNEPL